MYAFIAVVALVVLKKPLCEEFFLSRWGVFSDRKISRLHRGSEAALFFGRCASGTEHTVRNICVYSTILLCSVLYVLFCIYIRPYFFYFSIVVLEVATGLGCDVYCLYLFFILFNFCQNFLKRTPTMRTSGR